MALTPMTLAELIRTCLCQKLEASYGGKVCRCLIYPSPTPPADICDKTPQGNGQATVSIVRSYPSRAFPEPDTSGKCDAYLAIELAINVYRCAPQISDVGELPPISDYEEAARIQAADAEVMKCAVLCCLPVGYQVIVGEYDAYPASGGCMGGSLSVLVAIENQSCV